MAMEIKMSGPNQPYLANSDVGQRNNLGFSKDPDGRMLQKRIKYLARIQVGLELLAEKEAEEAKPKIYTG